MLNIGSGRRSEIRIKNLSAAQEIDLNHFDHKMIQAHSRKSHLACVLAMRGHAGVRACRPTAVTGKIIQRLSIWLVAHGPMAYIQCMADVLWHSSLWYLPRGHEL